MVWTGGEVMAKGSYAYSWDEVERMLRAAWDLDSTEPAVTVTGRHVRHGRRFALLYTLAYTGRRPGEIVGNYDTKARHVKAYWVTPEGKVDKSKFEVRPAPLPGLTPGDIDFERGVITFTIEKKFKRRNTPAGAFQTVTRVTKVKEVDPKVLGVLNAFIIRHALGPHDRIFPFTIQWAWQLVKECYAATGIKGREQLVKAFRHGFVMECLKQGETAEAIADLQDTMEHQDIGTTMGYSRFRKRHVRELLARVGRPLGGELSEESPLVPSETEQNKPV